MFAYHGGYLDVDVGRGDAVWRELSDQTLRHYLGGSGLGSHLMLQQESPAEPLSPQAPLAFVFSPLVGSPLTTSAKFAVVCRSPLTGRFSDSLASSGFALAGKRAAGDALLVRGRADTPSLLVIDDGVARLEPAGELWGQSIPDTEAVLKQRFPDFQSAVIGPGGEAGVRYATISHDGRHAGRGGSGAALGAKRIKAILVRGSRRCQWARPQELIEYARQLSARSFGPATAKYRELGTAANLLAFNRMHTLPTRNFQRGSFDGVQQLAPEAMSARRQARNSCAACTIGCEHIYGIQSGGGPAVRVEYESLFALGSLCEIGDPEAVLGAIAACDQLGLDTISFGGTVAFAMECVERGLLDEPWLRFGNGAALGTALEHIRQQSQLGKLLGSGSRCMAEAVGGGADQFAPHVKGLEIPGYAPQALHSMAVGFAVGARGADHNRSGAYEADFSEQVDRRDVRPDQISLAVASEDKAALMDSLVLCKFLRGALPEFHAEAARMLQLTAGWEVDAEELQETAERIVNAKKLFNIRCGWTRVEDTLPPRMLQQPLTDDPLAQLSEDRLASLVDAYYALRQWTPQGIPLAATLRRLNLPAPLMDADLGTANGR